MYEPRYIGHREWLIHGSRGKLDHLIAGHSDKGARAGWVVKLVTVWRVESVLFYEAQG